MPELLHLFRACICDFKKVLGNGKLDFEGQIIPQNNSIDASRIIMSMHLLSCYK